MPRLIALDLGSHAVKVTLFSVTGRKQVELEQRYWPAPVPQDGTAPTLEHRLAAFDALLDDTPEARPSGSDVVVLAWPASEAAFHRVAMPFIGQGADRADAPVRDRERGPVRARRDGARLARGRETGQTQVLVVLSKRARVGEVLAALERAGHRSGRRPRGRRPVRPVGRRPATDRERRRDGVDAEAVAAGRAGRHRPPPHHDRA